MEELRQAVHVELWGLEEGEEREEQEEEGEEQEEEEEGRQVHWSCNRQG